MNPRPSTAGSVAPVRQYSRRQWLWTATASFAAGCTVPWKKEKSEQQQKADDLKALLESKRRPKLLVDAVRIDGLHPQRFQAYGVVDRLLGTGGDVRPGPARDYVLREMRIQKVDDANGYLKERATAVVKLRVLVPPGVTAGSKADVVVEIAGDCEATDLRNGYLLPARLMEFANLDGQMRQSDIKAKASGPLLSFPPSLNSTGEYDKTLAVILGGATVIEGQVTYLRLSEEVRHVISAQAVVDTINERFDIYVGGRREKIADAKSDRTIELKIPTVYVDDLPHFADVLLHLGFMESASLRRERLAAAAQALLDPLSTQRAAFELEAAGEEGVAALTAGLTSLDPDVSFMSARALAYLNRTESIVPLTKLCSDPTHRIEAIRALSKIDHIEADNALVAMLTAEEIEVRYRAMEALRTKSRALGLVSGQSLGKMTTLTHIPGATPSIAVSLTLKPDIVLYGPNPLLRLPCPYTVNRRMTITESAGQLKVTRLIAGGEDQVAFASGDLVSLLHAMAAVDGTYTDALQLLDDSQKNQWLDSPVIFNPLATTHSLRSEESGEDVLTRPDIPQDPGTVEKPPFWSPRRYFNPA